MLHRSLIEVVSSSGAVVKSLVLRSSPDLVCNNLFCEKVTQPCICRLDRVLKSKKLIDLIHLDLSHNKLAALPPSIDVLKNLEELDISNNNFSELPSSILSLPNLKILKVKGNNINLKNYKFDKIKIIA